MTLTGRRAQLAMALALITAVGTAAAVSAGAQTSGTQASGTQASGTQASAVQATTRIHWAPATHAKIRPGVSVTIAGVQCVAGYLLTDGHDVYLALPGSCSGVGDGDMVNGCSEAEVPPTTPARVAGARYKARYVWGSFSQMALRGETNQAKCQDNSLSLVRLDRRDIARANPSILAVGGPTGVSHGQPSQGERLTAYIGGPAQALAMQNGDGGWAHMVFPSTGVPRTSVGSPVLHANGRAVGMVTFVPQTQGGPTTITDLAKALAYLHTVSRYAHVRLATGTEKFTAA